jgi:hypothetical protein
MVALFITLFPAYSIRPLIYTQLSLMPALIFMLLATRAYITGRKVQPYIFITVSLLTYESFIFPFIAAPLLLDEQWDRKLLKKLIIHTAIISVIVLVVIAMRSFGGESRMVDTAGYAHEIPKRMAIAMIYGAYESLFHSFYYAVIHTLANLDALIIATVIAFTVIIAALLLASTRQYPAEGKESASTAHLDDTLLLRSMVAGIAFIALSYTTGFFPAHINIYFP